MKINKKIFWNFSSLTFIIPLSLSASCNKKSILKEEINDLKKEFKNSNQLFLNNQGANFLNTKNFNFIKSVAWKYATNLIETYKYFENQIVPLTKTFKNEKEINTFLKENFTNKIKIEYFSFINTIVAKTKNNEKMQESKNTIYDELIKSYQNIISILNPYLNTNLKIDKNPLFLKTKNTYSKTQFTFFEYAKSILKKEQPNFKYSEAIYALGTFYALSNNLFWEITKNINFKESDLESNLKKIENLNQNIIKSFLKNIEDFKGLKISDPSSVPEWISFVKIDSGIFNQEEFNKKKNNYLNELNTLYKELKEIYQKNNENQKYAKNIILNFVKILK